MCSSQSNEDPTTYDTPRATCQRMIWVRGEDRRCGQSVGVTTWTDSTGQPHTACVNHVDGMKRRYPASLPAELAKHGTLGLSTPWARGAFGPADRIEVENLIPPGWRVGVSAYQGQHGRFSVWLMDPDMRERHRWEGRRDVVNTARELARMAQAIVAEGPAPDVLVAS